MCDHIFQYIYGGDGNLIQQETKAYFFQGFFWFFLQAFLLEASTSLRFDCQEKAIIFMFLAILEPAPLALPSLWGTALALLTQCLDTKGKRRVWPYGQKQRTSDVWEFQGKIHLLII